jgi:eukaryotic-like serine/threonine-protein kinase
MEFVYGISLRQTLDETPVMAVPEAIGVMLQVLDALASMHAQDVIHQDIKPANIMLTPKKQVKVGDFGVSKIANTETTTAFTTAGTPAYMSPEQCRGEHVDGRSDLFSAGTMLFEMVAGERAFSGRNITEVSHRIQNERLPLLPAELRAAVPRLQLLLERATGKHPEDRFDTAADMADALRQVLAGLAGDATRLRQGAGATSRYPPTIQVASRPPPPGAAFDPAMLRSLEDKLRVYVGPIAPVLVRAAASRGQSADELCSELARSVHEDERERFRGEAESLIGIRRTPAAAAPPVSESANRSSGLPQAALERAQAALAQFVGPIARVHVRQMAAKASSVEALWQGLAQHIESSSERTAFLQQRPK